MQVVTAIIFGVVTGVLYGLAALGIVLVYRVSRVLNFALAGTAAITTYEASTLTDAHWPYVAIVVVVLLSGAALGAACYWIMSLASGAGRLAVGVGTIGLLLALQGLVGLIWGTQQRALPPPISGTWKIGSITLSYFEVMAVAVTVVAIFLTFLLVFRTRLGLHMRAVSAGARTAELLGINHRTTELWAWVLGGAAGSLAGLLIVPLFQLDQNVMTNFMLAAFAAVVIGGFTSLFGVLLAGVTVSIALNLLSTYVSSTNGNTFTLLLIAFVLFVRPHGLFGMGEREVSEPQLPPRRGRSLVRRLPHPRGAWVSRAPVPSTTVSLAGRSASIGHLVLAAAVVAALAYGLAAGGSTSYVFATALATFVAVLGVSGLTGLSGQVSLGQGAFVGLGAYAGGIVSVHLHTSIWVALPLALVTGAVVGLVVGWPAARLSGVYLVVFTLAFGLAIPELLLDRPGLTGGGNGLIVNVPTFMQNARNQYLVTFAVAAAAAAVYAVVARSQLGRRWRAVQDSEMGVAAVGWSPTVNKVTAFALGSALTALGGSLTGILTGYVSPDGFGVFLSIYLIIAVILGGPGTILGSMVGALVITLLPYYLSGSTAPQIIFGAALVLILIAAPEGLANRLMRRGLPLGVARASGRRPAPSEGPATVGSAPDDFGPTEPSAEPPTVAVGADAATAGRTSEGGGVANTSAEVADPVLDIRGLTVAYAGGAALRDMSLQVGRGDAVAVVGANGAGKSTLLRAVSGWVRPLAGQVLLDGNDIAGLPAFEIARLGVAHVPEGRCVFPDLSVADNLRLGYRSESGEDEDALMERAMTLFPKLKQRVHQQAGSLSGGEQQMLAVGRGLVAAPRVLLLDEPSLGLAPVVIDEMFQALTDIVANGVSVLLVEQNVHSALSFARRGFVVSRGECVMQGIAGELAAKDDLISAFLVQA